MPEFFGNFAAVLFWFIVTALGGFFIIEVTLRLSQPKERAEQQRSEIERVIVKIQQLKDRVQIGSDRLRSFPKQRFAALDLARARKNLKRAKNARLREDWSGAERFATAGIEQAKRGIHLLRMSSESGGQTHA